MRTTWSKQPSLAEMILLIPISVIQKSRTLYYKNDVALFISDDVIEYTGSKHSLEIICRYYYDLKNRIC